MKKYLRVFAMICIVATVFVMIDPAVADNESYKGDGKIKYTIITGAKDATLKISVAKGKLRGTARSWFFGIKHEKTIKCGASYSVTVTDFGSKTVSSDFKGDASYKLQKNRTYYVTIEYVTWLPNTLSDMTLENTEMVEYPTVKLSVNNNAKIEKVNTNGNATIDSGMEQSTSSRNDGNSTIDDNNIPSPFTKDDGNQSTSSTDENSKKQQAVNLNGLGAWWAGSSDAFVDYIHSMDSKYERTDNGVSKIVQSSAIIGYELNDWIELLNDNSTYLNYYNKIIQMGCKDYDCGGKQVRLIESETYAWGGYNNIPKIRDEYYLFEVTGDGYTDKICIRMNNTGWESAGIEGRIYEQSNKSFENEKEEYTIEVERVPEDALSSNEYNVSNKDPELSDNSLYAMYNELSYAEYYDTIRSFDSNYGRTTIVNGTLAGYDIGDLASKYGASDAKELLVGIFSDPFYQSSSGVENVLTNYSNVSLTQTELYGWGYSDDHSSIEDEYYRFEILNDVETEYHAYDVILRIGYETDGGDWYEGRIMNFDIIPKAAESDIAEVEDIEISEQENADIKSINEPGELYYLWNQYASLNLWGDDASQCDISDRLGIYSQICNHEFSFSNGVEAGTLGDFFGNGAHNAKTWFINVAKEEQYRHSEQSISTYLSQHITENDNVDVLQSELYKWYLGKNSDNLDDMYSEEEFYKIVVVLNSIGEQYEIMINMTSLYDCGEYVQSVLLNKAQINNPDMYEGTPNNVFPDTHVYSDNGLANNPLDTGLADFYARYSLSDLDIIGDYEYDGDKTGWTISRWLFERGYIMCVVDNNNDYINLKTEADNNSKTLQRAYPGTGLPVLATWKDWALCVCPDYEESNPVSGWVQMEYLISEEEYAERNEHEEYYDNEDNNAYEDYDDINESYPEIDYNEETSRYVGNQYVVNCEEWVSLRYEPNTSSGRLAKVPLGAMVNDCYESENGFYYCEYNGITGYILKEYLSSDPSLKLYSKPNPQIKSDDRFDLSQYEYLPVVEYGRGALVFQKEPRGSFMKKHKFHDGDYIYVNVNWRQNGYAIAYEDGDYGYVDASYIDW